MLFSLNNYKWIASTSYYIALARPLAAED